ncbi:MAG: hypothetical protein JST23_11645 [Bacteroidetes bacterium]|nr:hypothetical protein [Bacteroidota bacterium]
MRIFLSSFLCLTITVLNAQVYYYYNDIVATEQLNQQMKTYLQNKVKSATAVGYTPQGSKATDFSETYQILENGSALRISSLENLAGNVLYYKYNSEGKIISMADSSNGMAGITTYQYDAQNRIKTIENHIKDDSKEFEDTEVHQWIYTTDGKIEKMWRIKNGKDSIEVRFIPEEHGFPGEEVSYKNGRETDHIYYYFDASGKVTDIVRYNKKVKKLMPEIMFSYDDSGRIIQKIISSESDNYGLKSLGQVQFVRYLIWRYVYNAQGLKTKEALFDKNQEMTGKIEYGYTYFQ